MPPLLMEATNQEITARDNFVIQKHNEGFSGDEIKFLLKRNHFKKISAARIYQILERQRVVVDIKK